MGRTNERQRFAGHTIGVEKTGMLGPCNLDSTKGVGPGCGQRPQNHSGWGIAPSVCAGLVRSKGETVEERGSVG